MRPAGRDTAATGGAGRWTARAAGLLLAALVLAGAGAARAQAPLARYDVDPGGITVSGISSGAYMAHQMHVVHSATINGAALFAGGPYACAGDEFPWSTWRATNVCMNFQDLAPFLGPPDVADSLAAIATRAKDKRIDDPRYLARARVYLFSGTDDTTVPRAVVETVAALYGHFLPADAIEFKKDLPAGHAMITARFGNAQCGVTAPPFLNACDYDGAGAALSWLYGALKPPATATGQLLAFDQREFGGGQSSTGMGPTGYLYVPKACAEGAPCRLHVAFHGCQQTVAQIGDAFIAHAGYNEWAEANDILVLYPQAAVVEESAMGVTVAWPNPKGCWDWWGFTGPGFDVRDGVQIQAIKAMIDRMTGGVVE